MYYVEPIKGIGADFGTWPIIALILSVIGGILMYIFFITPKKENNLSPFLKWLKDFLNFDKMMIEIILKVVYLISTIYVILTSISFIAYDFGMFFLYLVLGVIFVRLIYELILINVCIWKNTTAINKKMK